MLAIFGCIYACMRLKWIDVDTKRGTITLNCPEKRGNPRIFKVNSELFAMLNRLHKKTDNVFGNVLQKSVANTFRNQRRKISSKLGNPRILRISFHAFRHWKATMEYPRTKDILHVKKLLGHKNINNTLIYTHLVNFESDEYPAKVAETLKEACELAEAGFDYFTTINGAQIFRKRK